MNQQDVHSWAVSQLLLQDFNDKLHFRELAKYFVQSYNPKLYYEIVILDAIWHYDYKRIDGIPTRHHAHDFVKYASDIMGSCVNKLRPEQTYAKYAEKLISDKLPPYKIEMIKWIAEWLTNYA